MTSDPGALSLVDELLTRGVDDWVYLGEVADVARRAGPLSPEDCRHMALGVVAAVLVGGLMVAGDVTDDGFVPWALGPEEALGRIAREWFRRANPDLPPGAIGWLCTTPRGEARGEALLAAV